MRHAALALTLLVLAGCGAEASPADPNGSAVAGATQQVVATTTPSARPTPRPTPRPAPRPAAQHPAAPKTTPSPGPALNEDGSCLRGLGHIPNVNGMYYTNAINVLRAAGFDNVKLNKDEGPHVDQGLVLGQDVPNFAVCKDLAVWLDVGSMMGSIDHIANA